MRSMCSRRCYSLVLLFCLLIAFSDALSARSLRLKQLQAGAVSLLERTTAQSGEDGTDGNVAQETLDGNLVAGDDGNVAQGNLQLDPEARGILAKVGKGIRAIGDHARASIQGAAGHIKAGVQGMADLITHHIPHTESEQPPIVPIAPVTDPSAKPDQPTSSEFPVNISSTPPIVQTPEPDSMSEQPITPVVAPSIPDPQGSPDVEVHKTVKQLKDFETELPTGLAHEVTTTLEKVDVAKQMQDMVTQPDPTSPVPTKGKKPKSGGGAKEGTKQTAPARDVPTTPRLSKQEKKKLKQEKKAQKKATKKALKKETKDKLKQTGVGDMIVDESQRIAATSTGANIEQAGVDIAVDPATVTPTAATVGDAAPVLTVQDGESTQVRVLAKPTGGEAAD